MPVRKAITAVEPYRPQPPMAALAAELGLERIVKLASNEGAFGPLPAAAAAYEAAVEGLNRYPDAGGTALREELAAGNGVPAAQIVLGNGADELIRLCAVVALDGGDRAASFWPSFPSYPTSAACCGAEFSPVAVGDLDGLAAAAADPRTKLVYLANPNNPTGTFVGDAEVAALVEHLPGHVLCVLDEAYAEYADPEPAGIELVRAGVPGICVLRTFSKVYGLAALRIGYAVASPEIADALGRVRPIFNANQPAQDAALASLGESVADRVAHARNARDQLQAALASAGLVPLPSQANFVYAEVPGGDSLGLAENLLRAGFIVRELAGFGAPGAIRVTAGTDEENAAFAAALSALRA